MIWNVSIFYRTVQKSKQSLIEKMLRGSVGCNKYIYETYRVKGVKKE